jgi:hypothetical protein
MDKRLGTIIVLLVLVFGGPLGFYLYHDQPKVTKLQEKSISQRQDEARAENSTKNTTVEQSSTEDKKEKTKKETERVFEFNWLSTIGFIFTAFCMTGIPYLLTRYTTVKTGHMKLVVVNDKCVDVLLNVKGKVWNKQQEKIVNGNPPYDFLREKFNWFFLGLNPKAKVYKFDLPIQRVKKDIGPDDDVTTWLEQETLKGLTELRYQIQVTVLCPQTEFSGDQKSNLLVLFNTNVVNPITLLFTREGKFFSALNLEAKSFIGAFCQGKLYSYFVEKINKTTGGELDKEITPKMNLVVSTGDNSLGLEITGIGVVTQEEGDPEDKKANRAKRLALLKAEALQIEAKGKSDAAILLAKGEAAVTQAFVDAFKNIPGIDPDVAATQASAAIVANEMRRSEHIISVGGNTATALIPTQQKRNKGKGPKNP